MNVSAWKSPAPRLTSGALALLLLGASATTLSAQISSVGGTTELVPRFTRGVDVAYDPNTNTYLVVGSVNSVSGICVNADGKPIAPAFQIKPAAVPAPYAGFVRVAYSQHINNGNGGFLAVWPEEQGGGIPNMKARVVNCSGPLGPDQAIDAGATAWADANGPAIAYSPTSQKFLVVWPDYMFGRRLRARLVDINGTGVGELLTLSTTFSRDPGATWNPVTNEFGVSFSGENQTSEMVYSGFVRVPAVNPSNTNFFRHTWNFYSAKAGLTTSTDIDYNPHTNRFVMAWWQFGGEGGTRTAEFDAAGNLLADRLAASNMGSYDALSMAFNPVSGTHLVVGLFIQGNHPLEDFVMAAELDGSGVRTGDVVPISTSVPPARHPRVAASTAAKRWNTAWSSRNFSAIANQIVQTGSTGGGGGTDPGPTPGPSPNPSPNPLMSVDGPAAGATVAARFSVAGWAVDKGAPTGTGVDAVHVWAYPAAGGSPRFLGGATYGGSRPDVAAYLGSARFAPSGFALSTTLEAGTYDLVIYARSTLTQTFNNQQVVRVIVQPPASIPRMWVDYPAANQTLSQNIFVAGWAIDLGALTGCGVDAVHVWAFPVGGGGPMWVGAATLGGSRPDVGAAFGSSQFNPSGFSVQGTLPPGEYDLVVYARSALTKTFNNWHVVRIRVL